MAGKADELFVPVCNDLKTIYPNSSSVAKARYQEIKKKFEKLYGVAPLFYCRAPGRVNIIGEHIDYCGYGVLPMAIEQDLVIAAAPNHDSKIVLANMDPKFNTYEVKIEDIEKTFGTEWYYYFLCGFKGIVEHAKLPHPIGMSLLVDGNVPKNAGLSSSSAFVCCSGLVTMHANGCNLTKIDIAEVCTKCERYIGTEGGGMDQACSFLAGHGMAKHIEFEPLRYVNVSIPDGVVFVIANSLVEMNKSKTAGTHFNVRVVECRVAAQVLAKAKDVDWKTIRKLAQIQEKLDVPLEKMLEVVEEILHKEPYTREEICKILQITDEELVKSCLSDSTNKVKSFKLHDRAKHVYSEAKRVLGFREVCEKSPNRATVFLGTLMNESHDSCSLQYECSCDELDELVKQCRSAGALGARLTGAGWGGCTVSMVPTDLLHEFLHKVRFGYFSKDPKKLDVVDQSLFATSPGGGAAIITSEAVKQ